MHRNPGRYNLHRLGWAAFEDLCMQVMRVILGETCTRYRPGPDAGRDGWFRGNASNRLVAECNLNGNFVIQCKHTSLQHEPLQISLLNSEIAKIEKIAAVEPCHYLLMTNRQVSAISDQNIREKFESIAGVKSCWVFSETWIEDTIDAHPRLLRLVPRLYGIGDLSQIISSTIQQQTEAIIEDLMPSFRTFVPTESYRKADTTLNEHGFVVLVGPPASGKSAIAANLCMVTAAQDGTVRVLRIEQADQFKETWSPHDPNTIYWVDDVFGETTLDDRRLKEWSTALEKVEAARKRGARIIFCTRDYILAAAEQKLKKSRLEIVNDARVRVDVTALSTTEKESILYNHIKEGDISSEQKGKLKSHLEYVAGLSSFLPELARRLGNKRFHKNVKYNRLSLKEFFDKPVQHFKDVIHGIAKSETAALAVCLMRNNSVPDPITDSAIPDVVLSTYGVTKHQIEEAFEALEGSLVKRERQKTSQVWRLHHPSMIEALQEELSTKSSKMILYLRGAQFISILRDTTTILRDTTTIPTYPNSRLVFLPNTVYCELIERFGKAERTNIDGIASYLAKRASDEFLRLLDKDNPSIIDRALGVLPEPIEEDCAPLLAVRLKNISDGDLFDERRQDIISKTLLESVEESGWTGFLNVDEIETVVPAFLETFLQEEIKTDFSSLETLYDWYAQDFSEKDFVYAAIEEIESQTARLQMFINYRGVSSESIEASLKNTRSRILGRLAEKLDEIEEEEGGRADYEYDTWKDMQIEEAHALETSRFSDVDK